VRGALALFSGDYREARARFRDAASRAGMQLLAYPIGQTGPHGEELCLDVAVRGAASARRTLVVSSGTHGVEGYFGSAVQLRVLSQPALLSRLESTRLVLIHAINPYGFAFKRRVNEDNVDQNRNFVLDTGSFCGAPEAYRALDPLLNPRTRPAKLELFWLRAAHALAKSGYQALKNAVAQGQYDFPQGLFFGGHAASAAQRILRAHVRSWVGEPERVLHLDLHTGAGRAGHYALMIDLPSDDPRVQRLGREFGAARVQGFDPRGVLYEIRGALGPWLAERTPGVQYDCLLAEFGTYPALRVLAALRHENRLHHHAAASPALREAREALFEMFCPRSPRWRESVMERALRLVWDAAEAITAG
jgi:hypothetical protein